MERYVKGGEKMFKDKTKEEILNEIKKYVEETPGFIKYNNMHLEDIGENTATMYVDITENSLNPTNIAHGGLIFGLADSVMGMAARTTGYNVVTINADIHYIRPGKGKRLTATAEAIKVGKTTAVYRADIFTEDGTLCATSTATYFFLKEE